MNIKVVPAGVMAVMTTLLGFPSQGQSSARLNSLDELTVTNGLSAGCSLASRKAIIGFSRPVPIDSNPWRGTDRSIIASIREVMYGAPRAVDGPPLSGAEFSRFFFRLSHGIDEGYVAFYRQQGSEELAVHALTFSSSEPFPARRNMARADSRRAIWLEHGRTAIVLYGDEGPCSRAIRSHLESLAHQ